MNEIIPLILIALICLAVGFALGSLVTGLRKGKGENRAAEAFQEPDLAGSPPYQASQPASLPGSSHPGTLRLASLSRYENTPAAPKSVRPDLNPVNMLARAIHSDVQARPAAPKSIAAQVDEILQEKLAGRSLEQLSADKRAIRLLEFPGKGVVVMVGLEQYDGVEAVPDIEIRNLIREAVKEWETRAFDGEN